MKAWDYFTNAGFFVAITNYAVGDIYHSYTMDTSMYPNVKEFFHFGSMIRPDKISKSYSEVVLMTEEEEGKKTAINRIEFLSGSRIVEGFWSIAWYVNYIRDIGSKYHLFKGGSYNYYVWESILK